MVILERPLRLMKIKKRKKGRAKPNRAGRCALRPRYRRMHCCRWARSAAPVHGAVALVARSVAGTLLQKTFLQAVLKASSQVAKSTACIKGQYKMDHSTGGIL
jgi:hypothetical protein